MSSRLLTDLRPEVKPLVNSFLASVTAASIDMIITCTLRSNDEQAALYAQGRTTPGEIVTDAPPGESAHNYGLALDIVPVVNGKPDWKGGDPVWQQIGAIGQAAGLTWLGARGSRFPEEPHFEHPDWRAIVVALKVVQ
jgi:peptidoglycan LD-endopeptidase CwlK